MKVLVCGSRDATDEEAVWAKLDLYDKMFGISFVVEGGAGRAAKGGKPAIGVDTFAHNWAVARGKGWDRCPANWNAEGRAAGPIRNTRMLDKHPDIGRVLSFPGGAGTADMTRKARIRGIKVELC